MLLKSDMRSLEKCENVCCAKSKDIPDGRKGRWEGSETRATVRHLKAYCGWRDGEGSTSELNARSDQDKIRHGFMRPGIGLVCYSKSKKKKVILESNFWFQRFWWFVSAEKTGGSLEWKQQEVSYSMTGSWGWRRKLKWWQGKQTKMNRVNIYLEVGK